jgi:hypothetical protein
MTPIIKTMFQMVKIWGGGRIRTYDLQIMSLPSDHCSSPPVSFFSANNGI